LLHPAHRRNRRHDFRPPIGVVGVGSPLSGSSGISFSMPQRGGSDYAQTRLPQPVYEVSEGNAGETQLDVPWISSGSGDDVAETAAISAPDSS
jgi:hypothetical protein